MLQTLVTTKILPIRQVVYAICFSAYFELLFDFFSFFLRTEWIAAKFFYGSFSNNVIIMCGRNELHLKECIKIYVWNMQKKKKGELTASLIHSLSWQFDSRRSTMATARVSHSFFLISPSWILLFLLIKFQCWNSFLWLIKILYLFSASPPSFVILLISEFQIPILHFFHICLQFWMRIA